ncbi:MAG TPA: transglycosylase SLT domain-containing protein [Kofleriaceae bacterium]|nr:transglycosylase SLT domain-containing protein [Kofleriaceae bacterium]
MRRVAAALGLLCVAWCAGAAADTAGAADAPIHAGVQPAPPVRASAPELPQRLDGRRAVRGCPAPIRAPGEPTGTPPGAADELSCGRISEALRELELERFPPPSQSPWLDERAPPRSHLEAGPPRLVKRPSELRPDAPWLDQLAPSDLPVRWSQRLVEYLVFYRDDPRGRAIIRSWFVAQGRYRELIVAQLRRAKLPEDLLYVSMIESSYDPTTRSYAGALGLWQWMPAAAEIYGLRGDRWIDERRDPYRSTIAQLDYFRDLYQRFGDWHLALAAFNAGYGAVLRSIARYNTNDFYQLCEYENGLPWETCAYSPKVLATAIVGRNRAVFGLDKITPAPAEVWDEVAVPASIPLGVIARAAGVPEAEIQRLNPHLRHGRTPPGEPGYVVRVPPGKQAEAQRRLAELQSEWDGYDAYVVAHGERFEDVAATFGMTVAALKRLNDVAVEAEISGGTVLVVPRVSEELRVKNRAKARAALHESGDDQKAGEPLLVPVLDKDAVIAGKQRVFYRVVAGDTTRGVAKALGVSEADLELWNALDPEARLQPKMVLVAWVPNDFDAGKRGVVLLDPAKLAIVTRGSPEHLDLAEARRGRVRTEYVAQGKEKLEDVARKFGMRKYDLARINQIDSNTTLAKGDKLIVYQVTDPRRSERAAEQWQKTPKGRRGKVVGEPARSTAGAGAEPKPAGAAAAASSAATAPAPAEPAELPPEEDGSVTRPTKAD